MKFVWTLVRGLVGVLIGIATALVTTPAIAALSSDETGEAGGIAFLVIVAGSGVIAAFAPSIRRAFGRSFLLLALAFIALPVSSFLLSGRAAQEVVSNAAATDQAATAIGAGLAGAAITGLGTVAGIIFGAIFTILALVLLLGGRREVVVVETRKGR